ncbi:zinc ribbon domain-containing protein [Streptomyces avermitilis]
MFLVREHAGVQGRQARSALREDRPVRADLPTVLRCGVKDGPKPLHVREWTCEACRTVHVRDGKAAHNILAAGRADRLRLAERR